MILINENFRNLNEHYLFSEVKKIINDFKDKNPEADIVRLGMGDVSQSLPEAAIDALNKSVEEMGAIGTFRGYGPEQGYDFLINAIIENDYKKRGIDIAVDEIFVSDGSKSDTGNIGDILGQDNIVAVMDPVYPVFIDANVMAGRAGEFNKETGRWGKIVYLESNRENGFIPELPTEKVDVVYLNFPNNPTGTAITKAQLKVWVDYAIENKVLILFDAAYEAFIQSPDVPHSIYEIEGAKEVAIEFKSFSKSAGFTGTRCAYTVIPKTVMGYSQNNEKVSLNKLWYRRHTTKFNGVAYIIQRAAQACYSKEGRSEIKHMIKYYHDNAKLIREALINQGLSVYGGIDSPYIWVEAPNKMTSWEFFNYMLSELNVVGTPGIGFGPSGEGYLRLTAFSPTKDIQKAVERFKKISL